MNILAIPTKFSNRQQDIMRLLLKKPHLQNDLQSVLGLTAPNLHYHLNQLLKANLIKKETIQKMGNARINQVMINPAAYQRLRNILGLKVKDLTLITGFGLLESGYRVPDLVWKILRTMRYPMSKLVCFTTPESKVKRKKFQKVEKLQKVDTYYEFEYNVFRHWNSEFFQKVEELISQQLKTSNVIIDITPLTKLYSFKLLEMANKYDLPCVYLGMDAQGEECLFQMSSLQILGKISRYN
jgi:DNA-binding MarR family transcriptional regulator